MVNSLLTIFIRVNIPSSAESQCVVTGDDYEEAGTGQSWLLELAPRPRRWRRRNRRLRVQRPPSGGRFLFRSTLYADACGNTGVFVRLCDAYSRNHRRRVAKPQKIGTPTPQIACESP